MDTLKAVDIKKIYDDSILPNYATEYSSGMDLYAYIPESIILKPRDIIMVPTGISIGLPVGYEAQIRPRSGLAINYGITVLNSPGTIDSDYRGEIKIILINHGKYNYVIKKDTRIAQMIITKYTKIESWNEVDFHENTNRGENGFGSTGIN